jgi:hypothetical protein
LEKLQLKNGRMRKKRGKWKDTRVPKVITRQKNSRRQINRDKYKIHKQNKEITFHNVRLLRQSAIYISTPNLKIVAVIVHKTGKLRKVQH